MSTLKSFLVWKEIKKLSLLTMEYILSEKPTKFVRKVHLGVKLAPLMVSLCVKLDGRWIIPELQALRRTILTACKRKSSSE